ncbi:unnamed protein product [Adineta ricciae]|uniref:Uncharacterized protein n=1 Tax=Adineta ricciae TaxID=249248 RepID=A0A814NS19_ADIRI|nr:unnamed protein product [Adineta ricciae]
MTMRSHPPPIINEHQPKVVHPDRPTQTAWLSLFKRIVKNANTRYGLLWLTGGLLFCLFENYIRNKRKKESE